MSNTWPGGYRHAMHQSELYYMDGTDYEHELGNCTVALYASIEDLKASRTCIAECGIVAVRVEFVRYVEPGIPYRECGNEAPD